MAGKEREHVVEERDAGIDLRLTGAIDIQLELDLRLFGITGKFCYALFSHDSFHHGPAARL